MSKRYRVFKYDENGNETVQYGFMQSRAPMQVMGGGFGNGKTTALVMKALKIANEYPGSNGLLGRSTYPKLNDTLRKVFFEWCPKEWIARMPTKDDNTCILTNGSVINFRYVAQRGKQNPDGSTSSNLLSATYDWIGIDQVEDPEITEKDILVDLMGRMRGQTVYRPGAGQDDPTMPSTGPRFIMLTANPSHNWFFKKVIQPYLIWKHRGIKTDELLVNPETGVPILELFEGSTYTNKANLPPDFLRNLEATFKGQARERFLMGKWAAFEGLVYGEFSQERHALSREQIMAWITDCRAQHVRLHAIEAYDFGLSSPTCYLFGIVDHFGRIVWVDGFYESNLSYTKHPARIREIRDRWRIYGVTVAKPIYADPAIWKKTAPVAGKATAGVAVASLLTKLGLTLTPANNEITSGIAKMAAYFEGTMATPHIVTGQLPGPLLYVSDELEFFITEISSYFWKRNPQGQNVDEPIDANDHAMDASRYGVSKMPEPASIVVPVPPSERSYMKWHEVELDARRKRA